MTGLVGWWGGGAVGWWRCEVGGRQDQGPGGALGGVGWLGMGDMLTLYEEAQEAIKVGGGGHATPT